LNNNWRKQGVTWCVLLLHTQKKIDIYPCHDSNDLRHQNKTDTKHYLCETCDDDIADDSLRVSVVIIQKYFITNVLQLSDTFNYATSIHTHNVQGVVSLGQLA
jgi:hypothetical protein